MRCILEDFCLDAIVKEFARFNLAFTTTEDVNMKLLFEFLQRKYSFALLSRLYESFEIKDNYLDFLMNKHLKVLDTSWFRNCSWEKVSSKVAEIGYNIETAFFQDVYFDEFSEETPWQDLICYLPNLKVFTYHDDCHDGIIKNVATFCPDIEVIDIENSNVTFDAVKSLCMAENGKSFCVKLKKLCIGGTHIKDDGVKYLLKNLPSLEIIDYANLPLVLHSLHKNDFASLEKVEPYNITTLDLFSIGHTPFFADVLKVCLSVCPRLKCLTCAVVNKDELDFFSNSSNIEQLHIENFSDTEININDLLKLRGGKLTSLTVVNFTVSLSVLAEACPRVKELCLTRVCILFDEDCKLVFNSLSSFTFEHCFKDTKAGKALSLLLFSSPKLESLSFKRCNLLSSEIKAYILKCCELYPIKKISFCGSVLEKEYIKDLLLNCHTLENLNLDGCFDSDDEDELLKFSEILSNKPEIDFSDRLDISDYEEYLNGNYELEDDYYGYEDYDEDDYDYAYEYEDEDDSDDYPDF